ncbi:asparagine synthase-related protein [Bacillus paranthracis]|uniref:asparagine synthase-related protein n=1 Tax=Bacillus paranthracis TaxID=2026186 RepID=UPI002E24B1A9|nr:asparagine synthase-related protein [Bacillus paranthracis]MED1683887.1 asparagine synthase-related protein [Bacillus paranthracis]
MIYTYISRDSNSFKKTKEDVIYTRGYCYYKNILIENAMDLWSISDWESPNEWVSNLNELNGCYSVIKKIGKRLYAAVDRIRSYPLFYAVKENDFFVSDDINWIISHFKGIEYDELAQKEFLLTGYVTGRETLYKDIKQLQAGELLVIDDSNDDIEFEVYKYFIPFSEEEQLKKEEVHYELEIMLEKVFRRLVDSIKGKKIVLPLSGGYDSRLLALMLKKFGVDNILCYTYGKRDNWEAKISYEVAKQLGFEWVFVEYNSQKWKETFGSKVRAEYYQYADGECAIPCIQDFPAVWELKEKGLLSDDCVFIPGHTGDFLAGSHIPKDLLKNNEYNLGQLTNSIIKHHYILEDYHLYTKKSKGEIQNKIKNELGNMEVFKKERAINTFERWDWKERQAKFIVNSVRVYEFFGFDWRLPFWDYEFIHYWSKVPLEFRIDRWFYNEYIKKLGSDLKIPEPNPTPAVPMLKEVGKKILNIPILGVYEEKIKRKYRVAKYQEIYSNHFLDWYSIIPMEVFKENYSGIENINSFLVKQRLGKIEF